MLKMVIVLAVSLSLLGSPKPAFGSLYDCSKGLTIQAFSPEGFITDKGVYNTKNFGDSIYLDLKSGLKCRVYSSATGKIYFQTRERGDGTFTTWVIQEDQSYDRYDGAHIIANFDIEIDDISNRQLIIFIKIIDDKNPFIIKDTYTFIFKIIASQNI